MATVLIAETDPRALELLPQILSDHFRDVSIELCSSAEELCHKQGVFECGTMVVSPILFQNYKLQKPKWARHVAAPLLLTASRLDRISASEALTKDAFDVIVKPIVPEEAVRSVKRALWQNKLLTLLASREQATHIFRRHMDAFPLDWRTEAQFVREREAFEQTFQALRSSLRLLLDSHDERSMIDLAGWVENFTRQRALERLLTLCQDGTKH